MCRSNTKLFVVFAVSVLVGGVFCSPSQHPTPEPQSPHVHVLPINDSTRAGVEVGVQLADAACVFVEGVTQDPTAAKVCATVDELTPLVGAILRLRTARKACDGGCPDAEVALDAAAE